VKKDTQLFIVACGLLIAVWAVAYACGCGGT